MASMGTAKGLRVNAISGLVFLATAIYVLGLSLPDRSLAFSLAPLRIDQKRGQLQLSNDAERPINVQLQVFTPRIVQGFKTAGLEPLSEDASEALIILRRSRFHLGPGSTRLVAYRVVNPDKPFYICGTTLQGLFNVRVCSRWAAASAAGAKHL